MNIFITGSPGCGKSTLIKKLMERAEGRKIAGIITPEIRKTGKRWGFKIIDIVTGSEEILSSVEIKPPVVGRYGVNINGMERIIDLFLESAEDAEYIFIDEIGPMELHSSKFREVIARMLNSDKSVIATLHRSLVGRYESRGKIVYLTKENFDHVLEEVVESLKLG
ncbi:MAG: NTPase [Thermoplasmata archaeon]|nr:MAG: NTPase [Thermoplasmata archaeon]